MFGFVWIEPFSPIGCRTLVFIDIKTGYIINVITLLFLLLMMRKCIGCLANFRSEQGTLSVIFRQFFCLEAI